MRRFSPWKENGSIPRPVPRTFNICGCRSRCVLVNSVRTGAVRFILVVICMPAFTNFFFVFVSFFLHLVYYFRHTLPLPSSGTCLDFFFLSRKELAIFFSRRPAPNFGNSRWLSLQKQKTHQKKKMNVLVVLERMTLALAVTMSNHYCMSPGVPYQTHGRDPCRCYCTTVASEQPLS